MELVFNLWGGEVYFDVWWIIYWDGVFRFFGDWFDGSGWISVFVVVEVVIGGVVDFFIKVIYVIWIRWVY